MERNRNVAFSSDVEVDSLKDAVWRLTTRVYLLEDFIAERFGEVVGPNGYEKTKFTIPGSSVPQFSSTNAQFAPGGLNFSVRQSSRKRRKLTQIGDDFDKLEQIQRSDDQSKKTEAFQSTAVDNLSINVNPGISDISDTNSVLVLKNEVLGIDHEDSDGNDDFLGDNSDGDEDPNDSAEKDPDFIPSPNAPNSQKSERKELSNKSAWDEESACDKPKKKGHRGPAVSWEFVEAFDDEQSARNLLAEQRWRVDSTKLTQTGKKVYFSCCDTCPAKVNILIGSDKVRLYNNKQEHNHVGPPQKSKGIPLEARTLVKEMVQSRIKPRQMMEVLQQKGFKVKISQLSGFLKSLRKKAGKDTTGANSTTSELDLSSEVHDGT